MKSFDDLIFIDCSGDEFGKCKSAEMTFQNGFTVLVAIGDMTLGGDEGLYEMTCKLDEKFYYDYPFVGDSEAFLTEEMVSDIMEKIQTLELVL